MKKKYICPYCGKSYAMQWALENHKKECTYKKNAKMPILP